MITGQLELPVLQLVQASNAGVDALIQLAQASYARHRDTFNAMSVGSGCSEFPSRQLHFVILNLWGEKLDCSRSTVAALQSSRESHYDYQLDTDTHEGNALTAGSVKRLSATLACRLAFALSCVHKGDSLTCCRGW